MWGIDLKENEKKAFYKFFSIYFLSVASLILVAGFFFFLQIKVQYLKSEEFSIIQYARTLKKGLDISSFNKDYNHTIVYKKFDTFDIKNFTQTKDNFIKYIPKDNKNMYYKITKSTKEFQKKISHIKNNIHLIQLLLLAIFAFISYILAKNAIKPLQESIATLDKFIKDLIHDLNTPVTAIKLNMKLLEKDPHFSTNKPLQRIGKSTHTISELHENLTILLQEKTFQIQKTELKNIVDDVIAIHKQLYTNIDFICDDFSLIVQTNPNATKQILQNIISNGCKYNKKDGFLKIYTKNNKLYIQDSGKGIKNPQKIFDRSFSDENSSGLGLDIVKRLAGALNINIEVDSNNSGTTFVLGFS